MARPKLTLFLDVISPFAYMAFYVIRHSPAFKQCEITYVPVLLGGVFKACNNGGPLSIKNKDKWINVERVRHAKLFRIPIRSAPPDPFPQSTVNTGRALCAISLQHPSKLADAFAALYHSFWVDGKTIGKPEVILESLAPVLGKEEAGKVVSTMGGSEAKAKLGENTEEAVKIGCFGMPWFIATNAKGETEQFWGLDHIGQVVDHLGLERNEEVGLRALL